MKMRSCAVTASADIGDGACHKSGSCRVYDLGGAARMKGKHIIKLLTGGVLLAAFTLFLDGSGVGMRERWRRRMARTRKSEQS